MLHCIKIKEKFCALHDEKDSCWTAGLWRFGAWPRRSRRL